MRNNTGLSLGELIDALTDFDHTLYVQFDFAGAAPTTIDSYRGYYEDVAIGYSGEYSDVQCRVGKFLDTLKSSEHKTFTGWKGGDYVCDRESAVWVACPGTAPGVYIIGVEVDEYGVTILTERES